MKRDSAVAGPAKASLAAFSLLVPYAFYTLFLLYNMPLVGWDSLSYWAPSTIMAILDGAANYALEGTHHPDAYKYILAFSRYNYVFGFTVVAGGYLLLAFCMRDRCTPYASSVRESVRDPKTAICAYLFLSTPLLENHVLMSGYADLMLGVCYMLQLHFLCFSRSSVIARGLMFVCLGFLSLSLKSHAILGLAVVAGVALATHRRFLQRRLALSFFLFAGILVILWATLGVTISADSYKCCYKLRLLDYQIFIAYNSPTEVARAVSNALLINQSYSLLLVALLITTQHPAYKASGRPLGTFFFCYLIVLGFLMVTTDFFYATGMPKNDTTFSRFLLHAAPSALVAVARTWRNPALSNPIRTSPVLRVRN